MKHSLVFADSEVVSVTATAKTIRLRFSAAHVIRSDIADSSQPVEGFARGVELLLAGASLDKAEGELIGSLAQGRVEIDGEWSSSLALPSSAQGHVTLELAFANQSSLVLTASGIECRYEGEPNFSESLFC